MKQIILNLSSWKNAEANLIDTKLITGGTDDRTDNRDKAI